ncbi:DUF4365 domain-containing protein [Cronobacter dublinensis]
MQKSVKTPAKTNDDDGSQLPTVHENHITGESGALFVSQQINAMNYICRRMDNRDYGIDAEIEITLEKDDKKYATGKKIHAQIKCGPSFFDNPVNDSGWTNYFSSSTVNYWLNHTIPVIVIICDLHGNCYWQLVTSYNLERTEKNYKLFFPAANKLSAAKNDFDKIANSQYHAKETVITFLLDSDFNVQNDQQELEVLCGEAMLAIARKEPLHIDIAFADEFSAIETLSNLKNTENALTIEERRAILDAEKIIERYTLIRHFLSDAINLVFRTPFFQCIYNSFVTHGEIQVAQTIKGIFDLRARQLASPVVNADTTLEIWHTQHEDFSFRVHLTGDDHNKLVEKLERLDGLDALRIPGSYIVNHLDNDMVYSKVVPALVISLLNYLDRTNKELKELKLFVNPDDNYLFLWNVGLA